VAAAAIHSLAVAPVVSRQYHKRFMNSGRFRPCVYTTDPGVSVNHDSSFIVGIQNPNPRDPNTSINS